MSGGKVLPLDVPQSPAEKGASIAYLVGGLVGTLLLFREGRLPVEDVGGALVKADMARVMLDELAAELTELVQNGPNPPPRNNFPQA